MSEPAKAKVPPAERTRASLIVLATLCAIVFGVAVFDRPASTWTYEHLRSHRIWFDALTHLVDPLLPAASLGLFVAGLAALAGYRPGHSARLAIACCLAVILVVTLKDQAKYAFGRLWPETWVDNNPSWIGNGSYGFAPFHGGRGWASFPSGHTAVITAPGAVLWRAAPWTRVVVGIVIGLVMIGLFGADYHFLSDILSGALLGTCCGIAAETFVTLNWRLTPGD